MASLYAASGVLSSFYGDSRVRALTRDGLSSRSNLVLPLKQSVTWVPLKSTVGRRATSPHVSCLLHEDEPKFVAVPERVDPKPRVILIAGLTGVGKSKLSIELARALDGEIINAEHVYQGISNDGVKGSVEDRLGIPHHLTNVVPSTRDYIQSEFVVAARIATEDILSKGKVPILVGDVGMDMRMYMHNRADITEEPFEGELNAPPSWDYDLQCYFLYQHSADLYPSIDLQCEQTVPALLAETSWLMSQGLTPESNASARSPGYSEAMNLLKKARKADGFTSEQQFLQFVFDYQTNCKKLAHHQVEWFRSESRSEVRQFKWIPVDASTLEKLVDCLTEEYRMAPGEISRASLGIDLRNASLLEQRRLKDYVHCFRVFSDPAAVANMLDWIKSTQGGAVADQQRQGDDELDSGFAKENPFYGSLKNKDAMQDI